MDNQVISSAQNPTIKHIRKLLGSAKHRRDEGLAVAEGIHLLSSFLQTKALPTQVVYAEAALHNQEIVELVDRLSEAGVTSLVVKDGLFESLSQVHAANGVLMLFTPSAPVEGEILDSDSLLLESIQDPGNLGTILRTAAAAGVRRIYLSPDSASPWSPKCLRAGMGAQFSLEIYESVDLDSLVKDASIPVLATDLGGDKTVYDSDLTQTAAWVFGNEGQGVSPSLLQACSERVVIPQTTSSVESLNVSAAVAVCLFEQRRQREFSN